MFARGGKRKPGILLVVGGPNLELDASDKQTVAGFQHVAFDLLAVDDRAVRAAQILDDKLIRRVSGQSAMDSRNECRIDDEIRSRRTADGLDRTCGDSERDGSVAATGEHPAWHVS
jgi:hypothetical protein